MKDTIKRATVLVAWFAGLAGLLVGLHAAGRGALAGPDQAAPGTWADWTSGRTAPEAAMAVLRLVGIGLAWYLLAATAIGLVARLLGGARSVELADLVTLPFVRRVVQVGLGVGFAGAVVAAAGAGRGVQVERVPTAADVALATDDTRPQATTTSTPTTTTTTAAPAAAAPQPAPAVRTWVLQPGDHLWSIAEHVVEEQVGRRPSEREVHDYWRTLVERNRQRLPHPQDPDLVYAGLEIELPLPSGG